MRAMEFTLLIQTTKNLPSVTVLAVDSNSHHLAIQALKAHNHQVTYFGQFFKYHFHDLEITFEYTGVIPENIMSKYTQEVRVF